MGIQQPLSGLIAAEETRRQRLPGWSFCIITDGKRPQRLQEELASIRALALAHYEIIVAGNVPDALPDDVRGIHAPELAFTGRLGAMRNRACDAARYETLIVADDDMLFHPEFGEALRQGGDWDVLCVRLLNPDGTRYWDWATIGGPRGHMLLDYDDTDAHVYVTGGLAVMRAPVHERVRWDDERGFYQGEDVEWSARLRAAGMRIRFNPTGRVTHQDARYTQVGRVMHFRQDLTVRERLGHGIEIVGMFREGIDHYRWITDRATIYAPLAAPGATAIRFSLTSVAPALADEPFHVHVSLNGDAAGAVTFTGPQSFTLSLPLRADGVTEIVLESTASVSGHDVGISDERPVSVLIHDAELIEG
jgi:hypothetical protein